MALELRAMQYFSYVIVSFKLEGAVVEDCHHCSCLVPATVSPPGADCHAAFITTFEGFFVFMLFLHFDPVLLQKERVLFSVSLNVQFCTLFFIFKYPVMCLLINCTDEVVIT